MGDNLYHMAITVGTAKLYVAAALDIFEQADIPNPTLTLRGKLADTIAAVYHEGERWQSMPNRKEPCTPAMVRYYIAQADFKTDMLSFPAALADWAILSSFSCSL